jgi:hypothetical protein
MALRKVFRDPLGTEFRELRGRRVDGSSNRTPDEGLIDERDPGPGPVTRKRHVMNDIEVLADIQLPCDASRVPLPSIVVALEAEHR